MRLEFTPGARLDLLDAHASYEERVSGLGAEFVRAVDSAAAGITRFPKAFPKVHGEVRKAVLRRFPYSLLFVPSRNRILVLACFHHRRDPATWPRLS